MGATLPGRRVPTEGTPATTALPIEKRSLKRASYNDALKSWFAGDFERCVEQCLIARPPDDETAAQISLLQARALLRLSRPAEALAIVDRTQTVTRTHDLSLTAQMLRGSAHIRLGNRDTARAILTAARARTGNAHPTIQSEVALNIALAHYGDRDLAAAQRELNLVSPDADIVHARALEYRGWIGIARADYKQAADYFLAAIQRLDECRHNDRFLESNALQALSFFAAETVDFDLWTYLEERRDRFDWNASGLTVPRFWFSLNQAIIYESQGRVDEALSAAFAAKDLHPSPALALEAHCRVASILGHENEWRGQRIAARRAYQRFRCLDIERLEGDERTVPLAIAEALAQAGDADDALAVLDAYHQNKTLSPMLSMAEDPRRLGYERLVEGQAANAAGDFDRARDAFTDALRTFRAIGYTARALQAANELATITGQPYLFEYVSKAAESLPKTFWLRRHLATRAVVVNDQVIDALSPALLDVARLLCQGLTNKEIAGRRARSTKTVGHQVTTLFSRLGVSTRAECASECIRRGIYEGRRATDRNDADRKCDIGQTPG
jgi:DNA-binding CsgD family transcriptional regulator